MSQDGDKADWKLPLNLPENWMRRLDLKNDCRVPMRFPGFFEAKALEVVPRFKILRVSHYQSLEEALRTESVEEILPGTTSLSAGWGCW